MTAVQMLRAATASDHERVDAAFADFDLSRRDDYRRFLIAHARALPAAEQALRDRDLPDWRERTSMLAADLAVLGEAMPEALPFALPPGRAAALGALYVTEGSRLGGIMLARRVSDALPRAYLGARHEQGEWRTLLAAIDDAVADADVAGAVAGAHATFALYQAAVVTR